MRGGTHPSYIEERRRTTYSQNKLTSLLFKHKEQLKKDIAKKRSVLERELSIDISKVRDRSFFFQLLPSLSLGGGIFDGPGKK